MSTPERLPAALRVSNPFPTLPSAAHQLAARRAIDPLDVPPPATMPSVGRMLGRLAARSCYGAADAVRRGDCR